MSEQEDQHRLLGSILMDESYFGPSDEGGKQGRGTAKQKVIVSISLSREGTPRFMKAKVVGSINQQSVNALVETSIEPGATITTDGLSSYEGLPALGFIHRQATTDNIKKNDPLQWVHTIISNAKQMIRGTYHGVGARYLQAYLGEFCYRFNRRFREGELFSRLLEACVRATPWPFPVPSA